MFKEPVEILPSVSYTACATLKVSLISLSKIPLTDWVHILTMYKCSTRARTLITAQKGWRKSPRNQPQGPRRHFCFLVHLEITMVHQWKMGRYQRSSTTLRHNAMQVHWTRKTSDCWRYSASWSLGIKNVCECVYVYTVVVYRCDGGCGNSCGESSSSPQLLCEQKKKTLNVLSGVNDLNTDVLSLCSYEIASSGVYPARVKIQRHLPFVGWCHVLLMHLSKV